MTIIIIFIFGLCIGSFLNCVIYRLKKGESFLKGRSYCPHCRHKLGILDLIPVLSFIFLKGRCRYCKKKISWQYPIIEICTAVLFSLVFLKYFGFSNFVNQFSIFNFQFSILRDWFFISILIIIFVYDLKHYIIPDKIVLPMAGLALIINFALGYPILKLILSAVVISGFFLLQYLISKGKWIGFGDVKFGLLMGFLLSWPGGLIALFLAYIIGALVSIGLLSTKKKNFKSEIPFGPFLALATIIVLLYGERIFDWYLSIIYR